MSNIKECVPLVSVEISSAPTGDAGFSEGILIGYQNNTESANLSIYGTWAGTVTVQRSFDEGTTWRDITDASYTENQELNIYDPSIIALYRVGIKEGSYTSGTCNCEIRR